MNITCVTKDKQNKPTKTNEETPKIVNLPQPQSNTSVNILKFEF